MGGSLEARIKKLQEFYWSDADPDGRGFVSLADAYRRNGDPIEALRILRDGCRRHPEMASGHVVAGWTHAGEGDAAETEGAFRAALEVDPQNVAALKGLADVLSEAGENEAALSLLLTLRSLNPPNEELEGRIQHLQALAERLGEGEDELETEAAPEPEGLEPGPVWEDPESAAEDLDWEQAALQADESESRGEDSSPAPEKKEDALVTRTMGDILLKQGLLSEAERVFRELLDRDPADLELQEKLDRVQAAQRGERVEGADRPSADVLPDLILPIGDLAPDTVVSIDDLAPDIILPIETLAPDPPPTLLDETP